MNYCIRLILNHLFLITMERFSLRKRSVTMLLMNRRSQWSECIYFMNFRGAIIHHCCCLSNVKCQCERPLQCILYSFCLDSFLFIFDLSLIYDNHDNDTLLFFKKTLLLVRFSSFFLYRKGWLLVQFNLFTFSFSSRWSIPQLS